MKKLLLGIFLLFTPACTASKDKNKLKNLTISYMLTSVIYKNSLIYEMYLNDGGTKVEWENPTKRSRIILEYTERLNKNLRILLPDFLEDFKIKNKDLVDDFEFDWSTI